MNQTGTSLLKNSLGKVSEVLNRSGVYQAGKVIQFANNKDDITEIFQYLSKIGAVPEKELLQFCYNIID